MVNSYKKEDSDSIRIGFLVALSGLTGVKVLIKK